MKRTPFEKNYNLLSVFYIKKLRWGLYLHLKPRDWLRIFWRHPEADVLWYDIGPFAFYRG
jgi:hypothetical protein